MRANMSTSTDESEGLLPVGKRPRTSSKENRRSVQERWENSYFVLPINNAIRCVICRKNLAYAKETNIQRHFLTHQGELQKWNFADDSERQAKFEQLKAALLNEVSSSSSSGETTSTDEPVSTDRISPVLVNNLREN